MPVMPNLSTLATASIAVWWAAVITARRKTAPRAAAASPKPAPARTIPLTHEPSPLSFAEWFAVWPDPTPPAESKLDKWNTAPADSVKPLNEASAEDRAEVRDRICGHRGRRYFHDRPGHLEVPPMTQLWTIYNRHPDPYLAIRSGDDSGRPGDRVMTSDLPALRHRLAQVGLSR
jgi:hypothetical protein